MVLTWPFRRGGAICRRGSAVGLGGRQERELCGVILLGDKRLMGPRDQLANKVPRSSRLTRTAKKLLTVLGHEHEVGVKCLSHYGDRLRHLLNSLAMLDLMARTKLLYVTVCHQNCSNPRLARRSRRGSSSCSNLLIWLGKRVVGECPDRSIESGPVALQALCHEDKR